MSLFDRCVFGVYAAVIAAALFVVVYNVAWSPMARCAGRTPTDPRGYVFVVQEGACLPYNAFVPAR